ncbi:immunoglobulin superfamily member 3 isoform X2 [Nothobranchius furzeri]|uniref:Transcript variant X2 n=1 Tax=Nothobranchius furzeri TaxID=105023 RepID=A0A9D2Y7M1_NOTFU|nr:immunoglobulin superfamily member 3 isoform X2 [Nothobranchius furzeri]KAF7215716.1 transcript variant X2 [Nothobranchius furzeri]
MKSSLLSLCRPTLLMWMGFLLRCDASVNTEIQTGPLYRAEGSRLSISCNVSGFKSEETPKIFDFRVTKPSRPNELNIISSGDKDFSYSIYLDRVRDGDISVKYVDPNSAIFEIESLLKDDGGEYDCTVRDTEHGYHGTYNAKIVVYVIDNSLSVSSSDPTSLSYDEGDALTLTCQASSNTIQHTHLSVAWYLRKDGEDAARPIISLDRFFTLIPGPGFEQRYVEGAVRLDKLGEATYILKMAQLELSDQGQIFCGAEEWIQDPDRSWYMMTRKDAKESTLTVKAREVSETSSLVVKMTSKQTTLQEGEELLLSSSIDSQNLEGKFFSVAWLWNGIELVRIGPTGIVSVTPEYSERGRQGELRATRTGNRNYQFVMKPVKTMDEGQYVFRAWTEERGDDGAFKQGTAQDSDPLSVKISSTESELSVRMQDVPPTITQRDRLRLVCNVGGFKGQLSVTWKRKLTAKQIALFNIIVSLSQGGVMETAADFTSRNVRVMRPTDDSFVLELDDVIPSDSGVYRCTVTEWEPSGKSHSREQSANVTVIPIDSLVKVSLRSRTNIVTVGDNVELMCQVKGPSVLKHLIWTKQNNNSTLNNIVTLSSDGSVSWSGDQHHYQVKVDNQNNAVMYYLKIVGASRREAGIYQCMVSVFLENAFKKLPESNHLRVMVQNPVSTLALSSEPSISQIINSDVHINCRVTSKPSQSSQYAVTWLHQHDAANKTILSSDRKAVETLGSQTEQSFRQRVIMKRTNGPTFELTIRQARISDRGSYFCEVVEWLQDPRGDWYPLPGKSVITKLTVIEPANDLTVERNEQQLTISEGNEVELECIMTSGAPAFFYKVIWFYAPPSFLSMNASLVELDQTGLLVYPENQALQSLQGRLRLSRPSQKNFYLKIQTAHETDSGTYWCQVEQYQLDNEGQWKQKASESSGPVTLAVNVADSKLSIEKTEDKMNISAAEDMTIPCNIAQHTSSESQFQVTWFWQKDAETEQRPIFTAYRNSTFKGGHENVRFSHPLPHQFTLTILNTGPKDSGLYFCEVEEWLHSLTQGWRRAVVKKSGNLNVTVLSEGRVKSLPESDCMSGTLIVTLVVVTIILLFIILTLVLVMCRNKASNKAAPSLWTEQHPLSDKTAEI